MTKRAVLYARVSTPNQEGNTSLDHQIDKTRRYANDKGYTIVDEAREVISGTFVLARTKFNRYLEMMADSLVDVIIVDVPDRLGRGEAIANCELLVKMNHGTIEYTNHKYDLTTEEGVVMDGADKMISGLERLKTRRRTMEGKIRTAQSGRIIASRFRPYGYRFNRIIDPQTGKKVDCQLEIVDLEAEIVRQIFEWCAYDGLTTHRIAKRLTKMGVLTISDKEGGHGKKVGRGIWHRSTVAGMLSNSTYKGQWRYRKNKSRKIDKVGGARTMRQKYDKEDQIVVPVPAIVSPEVWDLAQVRLEENRQRCHKPTKHNYLLRSRVRCGNCGGSMSGMTQKANGRQYYRCIARYRQSGISGPLCSTRNLDAASLERPLWEFISDLMTDEDLLFSKIEAQQESTKQATRLLQQNLAALEAQNQKDNDAIKRYLDLYGDGGLSKEEYLSKRKERESKIEKRRKRITQRQQQLQEAAPLPPDRENALKQLREKVGRRINAATIKQKQELYSLLQIECTYNDVTGRVVITGVFGSHTLELKANKANYEAIDRSLQLTGRL